MAAVGFRTQVKLGAQRATAFKSITPLHFSRRLTVKATKNDSADAVFEVGKLIALTSVASEWAFSGQAQAATELAQVAAGDNRFGIILTLFLPVVGWVAFNILQPALNQLGRMDQLRDAKSLIGACALGAALPFLLVNNADAANEISSLAANDNRLSIILTLFLPVVGWVLFNIFQPAVNQLGRMDELAGRRGIAIGLGAGLTLLAANNAEAATELAQTAANDSRLSVLLALFIPPVGWVLFNILQPALNQLNRMDELRGAETKRRGVIGAVASGTALSILFGGSADAASELSQIAATNDNRLGIILTLFVPVVGWVLFNILQPALNQLGKMDEKRKG